MKHNLFDYFRNYSMPIMFAAQIVRLKVYMTIVSPLTSTFTQGYTCDSNFTFLTCNISDNIVAITFKLGMAVDLWMSYMLMLDARSQWVGKCCTLSATKQATSIQTCYNGRPCLRDLDLDFADLHMACPSWGFFFLDHRQIKTSGQRQQQ